MQNLKRQRESKTVSREFVWASSVHSNLYIRLYKILIFPAFVLDVHIARYEGQIVEEVDFSELAYVSAYLNDLGSPKECQRRNILKIPDIRAANDIFGKDTSNFWKVNAKEILLDEVIEFSVPVSALSAKSSVVVTLHDIHDKILYAYNIPIFEPSGKEKYPTLSRGQKIFSSLKQDLEILNNFPCYISPEDTTVYSIPHDFFEMENVLQRRFVDLGEENVFRFLTKPQAGDNIVLLSVEYQPFQHVTILKSLSNQPHAYTSKVQTKFNFNLFIDTEEESIYLQELNLNPVEEMNLILSKSVGKTQVDPTEKPDMKQKLLIEQALLLIRNPGHKRAGPNEVNLLWRFQYYMRYLPNALIPFFQVVNWANEAEAAQGQILLSEWPKCTIKEAIVIMNFYREVQSNDKSPNVAKLSVLKRFLVRILQGVSTSALITFLPQLFQFFRYDVESEVGLLVINKACDSFELSSFLMWMFEFEVAHEKRNEVTGIYHKLQSSFFSALEQSGNGKEFILALDLELNKIRRILDISRLIAESKDKVLIRNMLLKNMLSKHGSASDLLKFDYPVHLPLYPRLKFDRVKADTARVIPSNACPIVLDLVLTKKEFIKRIMFKSGDDLRQDEMILQLFSIADDLLKEVNLDMHLTHYKAIAITQDQGLIEFVNDSWAISKVVSKFHSIRDFFRTTQPFPSNIPDEDLAAECSADIKLVGEARRDDVHPLTLLKFIRSSAAYCVLTYLFAIMDRNLDNLMVRTTGELFHIDFGFIFGNDPKSFPTPIRLTKEMIIAMGGRDSIGYHMFTTLCCKLFMVLREHADLFLNLVALMRDARIPDLSLNQNFNIVMMQIKQRFLLDNDEKEAQAMLIRLINQSADALLPVIYDLIHNMATAIK